VLMLSEEKKVKREEICIANHQHAYAKKVKPDGVVEAIFRQNNIGISVGAGGGVAKS